MGSLWRSQEMELIQMIVANDDAHVIIEALGKLGICEFRDVRRPKARTTELLPRMRLNTAYVHGTTHGCVHFAHS